MGSWRRMGAFLGLVPADAQDYDGPAGASDVDRAAGDYHLPPGAGHDPRPEWAGGERPYPASGYRARGARRDPAGEPVTQGALAVQVRPEAGHDTERDTEPVAMPASRPVAVTLTGFGEARIVGERFRDGQPVILDMTGMDDSDARRLVDFAAGLAFALRGSIDKVATKVFMLLPSDRAMAGEELLEDARRYARS